MREREKQRKKNERKEEGERERVEVYWMRKIQLLVTILLIM